MLSAMRGLAVALALALPLHAATIPITLDSFSLSAFYYPGVNGSLERTGAWNASFTETSWTTYVRGTPGVGQGYHYARYNESRDQPYVQYDFYGTGIEFFGYWGHLGEGSTMGGGAGATSLSVQAAGYSGAQNIPFKGRTTQRTMNTAQPVSLGKIKDLTAGFYTASLRVTDGTISFTHAVFDADFGATQPAMEVARQNPVIRSPVKHNELGELVRDDDFGNWNGSGWTVVPDRGVIGTNIQNDAVMIDLGNGNYWMNLKGGIGTYGSVFRYAVSPSPPMLYEKSDIRLMYTPWEVYNASLLATTLDPTVHYTLSLETLNNNGWDFGMQELNEAANWFEISSLELWNREAGPPPSKGLPIGAIVGGVVGCVLVLIMGLAGIWWCVWGRHRRRRTISPADNFEIDESPVTVSTPFVSTGSHTTGSPRSSYYPSHSSRSSQVPLMREARGKRATMPNRQSVNRQSSSNRYSIDYVPTFQGIDAGPMQPGTATLVEVPPLYNPTWVAPALREGSARTSGLATPPSTPGSIFIEGGPILERVNGSPDPVSPATSNTKADHLAAPLSPSDSPRQ